MGKTPIELNGVTILEVDFKNYALQPINPNSLRVSVVQTGQGFQVTTTPEQHPIGHREGGRYQAAFYIENNKLKVVGTAVASQAVIDEAYEIRLTSIQTTEFNYTKFKFIN